jgi:hypothetical protein
MIVAKPNQGGCASCEERSELDGGLGEMLFVGCASGILFTNWLSLTTQGFFGCFFVG